MLYIVLIMLSGIVAGYMVRKKRLKNINLVTSIFIWILLFLLGIEIGENKEIINNLASLGVDALIIAVVATFGSILAAWGLWKYIFKKEA